MNSRIRFATWVFRIAAVYGVVALLPQYFLEERIGRDFPPPITHPEHFYGFVGVALAWQAAFWVISRDVRRYRLLMLPAVLEKLAFGVPAQVLVAQGRADPLVAAAGGIDLLLAALFAASFVATREPAA
jgi:hypothetical protein